MGRSPLFAFLVAILLGTAAPAVAIDLSVAGLTVTQAIQTEDQAVPLVADRPALVRIFVLADQPNSLRPTVRLQFVYGRKVRYTATLGPTRELVGVPTELDRRDHAKSWNRFVPAAWIKPGLKLVIEVDFDRRVRETNEANNLWPNKAGLAFDVRSSPPLRVTLVPVTLPDRRTPSVTPGTIEDYVGYARRVLPVPEKVDFAIHAPIRSSASLSAGSAGWLQLLSELEAVRLAERKADRHFVALVDVPRPSTFGGYALLPGRSAAVDDRADRFDGGRLSVREYLLAHELGHNLGLFHAPCGDPLGPDPAFPYRLANIGRSGFDVFRVRAYEPEAGSVDLMSYCTTEPWISDYHFIKALENRGQVARTGALGGDGEALLVWGRQTAAGWVLEPAFRVRGGAEALGDGPTAEVELLDGTGRVLRRQAIVLSPVDHGPGVVFAARIPLEPSVEPAALRLRVGGRVVAVRRAAPEPVGTTVSAAPRAFRTDDETVVFAWDAEARPVALLRDADTGEVLGFARDGRLELATRAERLEVLLSNGVDSVRQELALP